MAAGLAHEKCQNRVTAGFVHRFCPCGERGIAPFDSSCMQVRLAPGNLTAEVPVSAVCAARARGTRHSLHKERACESATSFLSSPCCWSCLAQHTHRMASCSAVRKLRLPCGPDPCCTAPAAICSDSSVTS